MCVCVCVFTLAYNNWVGSVKVWDPRVPDPVADMSPTDPATARDCWAVAFGMLMEACVCICVLCVCVCVCLVGLVFYFIELWLL